jgi:hypothetical protein
MVIRVAQSISKYGFPIYPIRGLVQVSANRRPPILWAVDQVVQEWPEWDGSVPYTLAQPFNRS